MDKRVIGNRLLELGFNPADKGFGYLIEAVTVYRSGMSMMETYNRVADKLGEDSFNIERCIRHTKEKTAIYKSLPNREMIARIWWNLECREATEVEA